MQSTIFSEVTQNKQVLQSVCASQPKNRDLNKDPKQQGTNFIETAIWSSLPEKLPLVLWKPDNWNVIVIQHQRQKRNKRRVVRSHEPLSRVEARQLEDNGPPNLTLRKRKSYYHQSSCFLRAAVEAECQQHHSCLPRRRMPQATCPCEHTFRCKTTEPR